MGDGNSLDHFDALVDVTAVAENEIRSCLNDGTSQSALILFGLRGPGFPQVVGEDQDVDLSSQRRNVGGGFFDFSKYAMVDARHAG